MKISLFSLLTILFLAGIVPVALCSQTDVIGFYFDPGAESNCIESAPYATVPVHLVLTNPAMDHLFGYEFGYTVAGSYLISGTTLMGGSPIDVGGYPGNHIVGLGVPLAPDGATVLATLSVFVMDDQQIQFALHGADPPSIPEYPELPVLLLADYIQQNPVLSVPAGIPSARINGQCNGETDEDSWDGVKSLYQ